MTSWRVSPETDRRIALLFPVEEQDLVRMVLAEECGNNLPFLEKLDDIQLERFRFAVLRLSDGKLDKLARAVALAREDWRDLLVAAGFAENLKAHELWLPSKSNRT
jgi:hypothetical protein